MNIVYNFVNLFNIFNTLNIYAHNLPSNKIFLSVYVIISIFCVIGKQYFLPLKETRKTPN